MVEKHDVPGPFLVFFLLWGGGFGFGLGFSQGSL